MSVFSFFKRVASNVHTDFERSVEAIDSELRKLETVAAKAGEIVEQRAKQIEALTVDSAGHSALALKASSIADSIRKVF